MNNNSREGEGVAQFNSGIDYLRIISELRIACHKCAVDVNTPDYQEWFGLIEQLHSELEPRMNKPDPRANGELYERRAELLRLNARKVIGNKSVVARERLRMYFNYVNRFAHDDSLILRNDNQGSAMLDQF